MKFFISLVAFCYLSSMLFAQTTEEEKTVLIEALRIVDYKMPVVYIKEISYGEKVPEDIFKKIATGKFYEFNDPNSVLMVDPATGETMLHGQPSDSLILTEEEKKLVITNLTKKVIWEDHLFKNSVRVTDMNQGYQKLSAMQETEPSSANKSYRYVFKFGRPVFIRNGTICLISIAAICGGECGRIDTSFYRKKGAIWERWISIAGGDF